MPADAACSAEETRQSLGQLFADVRKQRGLTPEQAARAARVMPPYLKMIECGDYSAIPDMLYLLPFFQRYAAFLDLDVKEVTSRFVRDFEAEENGAVVPAAPARPSLGAALQSLPWQRIAQVGAVAAVAVLLAGIAFAITRATSQRAAEISPSALTSLPPPVRVKITSTPAETSPPPPVAESPAPAATIAAAESQKAAPSSRHHFAHRASALRHRRHHRRPG